nr:Chain E, GLD52 peptide mimetic [Homo sapiens]6OBD_F Chain F, GLD52 peptide mimetic [Homo sapiens]
NDTSQTSSPS